MKNYLIYLKSHSMAPDYEDSCQAESLEEAEMIFYIKLKRYGWDMELIKGNVAEEPKYES